MKQIKAASGGENGRKMEDIENFLDETNCVLIEYDDKLMRWLIQNIKCTMVEKKLVVVSKLEIATSKCIKFLILYQAI